MKSKYLFIKCSGVLDESTLFVDVFIGHSTQDKRDCEYFTQLALTSSDYYFHLYDLEVSRYVQQIDLFFQSANENQRARRLSCTMSAAKLRRLLKSGLYDNWSQIYYQATSGLRRMNLNENHAYFLAVGRADNTLAMPHT